APGHEHRGPSGSETQVDRVLLRADLLDEPQEHLCARRRKVLGGRRAPDAHHTNARCIHAVPIAPPLPHRLVVGPPQADLPALDALADQRIAPLSCQLQAAFRLAKVCIQRLGDAFGSLALEEPFAGREDQLVTKIGLYSSGHSFSPVGNNLHIEIYSWKVVAARSGGRT